MTYDEDRRLIYFWGGDYCVSYGSHDRCASHEEFWSYDVLADRWSLLLDQTAANTPGFPRGRCLAAFVHDPKRKVVWMTGGEERYDHYDRGLLSGGLWAFDPALGRWSREAPAPDSSEVGSTESREVQAMAHDWGADQLFVPAYSGGSGAFVARLPLTWLRGGRAVKHSWQREFSLPDEPTIGEATLAMDTRRRRAILYLATRGQTYAYDLASRRAVLLNSQILPANDEFGMVYDSVNDVVVLFGGFDAFQGSPSARPLNDLWIFSPRTNHWTKPSLAGATPSPRHGDNLAFDSWNNALVLWGGTGGWQSEIDEFGQTGSEIFLLRLDPRTLQ